tara:strand:- start:5794 stop:6015 length:222 start_codon:yes stop_codon:yes gene_type:complete
MRSPLAFIFVAGKFGLRSQKRRRISGVLEGDRLGRRPPEAAGPKRHGVKPKSGGRDVFLLLYLGAFWGASKYY